VAANFVELMLQAILREYGAAALIVVGAVLVPVTEEVVFRYILLEGFRSQVPLRWANGLQALFFALAHENLAFVPFFTLFGFVAGKLRLDSRSLLPSILLHASWNLFICLRLIALT
jgi:membrane protease YdiL (CAAX protease family)